jgi:1,4-alpha-glucan branching enzyme
MPEDNMTNFNNVDARDIIVDRDASGRVTDIKPKDSKSKIVELNKKGGGVFEISNVDGVKDNDRYRLLIVKGDNVIEKVKDPYAKKQTHVMGWSSIYDSDKYQWKNTDWIDGKVPSRVSRQKGKGLRNIGSLRIMEINIPTFTEEGDFAAAKDYVRRIALNNLANTVEIMPTDGANGKGWTYDGVDKFAASEKNGGPDKLKELIDYIHKYKLNVIMDIVPNHMGPDGDMLARTGPYERGPGGFGSLYNYEGDSNRYVRDYIVNMALHWAGEYKVDGLRLDMTKPMYMGSDFTLKQIATEVNEHYPDVFLIAEDGEGNRAKITTPRQGLGSHEADVNNIDRQVDKVAKHQGIERLDDIGFDSEWDFPLFHELHEVIMGGGDLYKLDAAIRGSNKRVSYIMSHDEIGNMDGTRLITKIVTQRLGLFYHMEGNTTC